MTTTISTTFSTTFPESQPPITAFLGLSLLHRLLPFPLPRLCSHRWVCTEHTQDHRGLYTFRHSTHKHTHRPVCGVKETWTKEETKKAWKQMSGPSQSPLGLCLGEMVTLSSPSGFISGVRVTVQHLTVQFTPNNNFFLVF